VIGFLYNEREESDQEDSSETEGDQIFLCRLLNYDSRSRAGYRIELPASFANDNKNELASAAATLCISDGQIDREAYRVIIAEGAQLSLLQSRRKLQSIPPIVGRRSVLAIQLTTTFMSDTSRKYEEPGLSSREIEGSIFGTGPNAPGHDLVSQYKECSFGALDIRPAEGVNIINGVAQVELRAPIAGGELLGSLQDDIIEATEEVVGSLDQYDHVIYCIPDDALMDGTSKWTAFTYFHSHWSFFQRRRCSAMSVTIHELGHNLGFRHSGYQTEAYGDESGYMGFTVYETGAPLKCFNGHKNWVSGWFSDREHAIDPALAEPVLDRLVTFVDYAKLGTGGDDVVLMRVGPYYIQYNRAKGINVDTGMHANQVSITYAKDNFSDSEAVIGLSAGQKTKLANLRTEVIVEVCQFGTSSGGGQSSEATLSLVATARQSIFGDGSFPIDFAWVSVYLNDGKQKSQCHSAGQDKLAEPSPSEEPNKQSSSRQPSFRPTGSPSRQPTSLLRPTLSQISDLEQGERVQKKSLEVSFKDTQKLEVEEIGVEEPKPAKRLRQLKGGN